MMFCALNLCFRDLGPTNDAPVLWARPGGGKGHSLTVQNLKVGFLVFREGPADKCLRDIWRPGRFPVPGLQSLNLLGSEAFYRNDSTASDDSVDYYSSDDPTDYCSDDGHVSEPWQRVFSESDSDNAEGT